MEVRRINAFGINFTPHTISEYVNIIDDNISNKRDLIQQTGINAHSIVCAQTDKRLEDAINRSQLVNIDGMSVVWALKLLGFKKIKKASCPDIFDQLIERACIKQYKIYFLGARPEIIEKAVFNLRSKNNNIQIVGYHHGYFNQEESLVIAQKIKDSKADMLFLGLPSPQKELFSDKYLAIMNVPYVFGVGGLFDILAKVTKRAPMLMQNIGLEWLYRFLQEPVRLWNRYTIGNMKFIYYVFKERVRRK